VIAPMLYAFESIPSALRSGDVEKIVLRGHPKPAIGGHFKTGQR
jgi:hypothetical protein